MTKNRIRITTLYLKGGAVNPDSVDATVVKTGKRGWLDRRYIPERKWKEMRQNGFAYINQYPERIV